MAGFGVLGCTGSFLVLIAQAATQDIVSLASMAALLGGAHGLEHLYLHHRRKERIASEDPVD